MKKIEDGLLNMLNFMVRHAKERGLLDGEIEEVTVVHKKSKHNTPRACYENAFHIVTTTPGAKYVLGWVLVHGCPVDHAWVMLENGEHIDPTLKANSGYRYFRVLELGKLEVTRITIKRRCYPDLYSVFQYRSKEKGS